MRSKADETFVRVETLICPSQISHLRLKSFFLETSKPEMARAAKRPASEPLTGLITGSLTARFYLCLLLGRYEPLPLLEIPLTWLTVSLINVITGW